MPYRVDFRDPGGRALERLIDLGALDVEARADGRLAAVMPDGVAPDRLAAALDIDDVSISPAIGRDADSVWVLRMPAIRVGGRALRLTDSDAFGTGLHPTTALCLEALQELVERERPDRMLDVGTGSGVLALAALTLGVPRVLGIDIDEQSLRVAAENARVNELADRLELAHGGPEVVAGVWPLVVANILAAPLIEMASALGRRVGGDGHLVLSGIPSSVAGEVERAYRHVGMHRVRLASRDGWVAVVLRASWTNGAGR